MQSSSSGAAAPKGFPRGWCSAQRIQNPMIAGGNHTTIPSCHGVAPKSRPMTDEECGRQCSDLGNVKTYTEGAVLVVTPLEVCDIVPTCRFPPEFLSRPFGPPSPRERALGWYEDGHPGRGGPTILTVGNAVPGVPQNTPNQPPHPGESARSSHLSFRGAQPRGNLLEKSRQPYEVPGDCHVASLLAMTWWFLRGPSIGGAEAATPGGVALRANLSVILRLWNCCHCRAVGLRPPSHHEWWGLGRPQGSPLRAEVQKRPPLPGWPYG